ncbi:MAG: nitrogenase stabilizing/protective protein NifW [Filomicrobium sp.]
MSDITGPTVIDQLKKLSSAEDFFLFFFLPYEEKILKVARLHIMRRMGHYISNTDFSGMGEDEVFLTARLQLKRAYLDFIESTPQREKVFKVFQDQVEAHKRTFVRIEDISTTPVAAE